jgi:hypothetical protein
MAQSKPETVLYVSNAGGPEIYVMGMNRPLAILMSSKR